MKKCTFLLLFAIAANLIFCSNTFSQITQVTGSPQSAVTTGTTLTITRPSGLAVGDVMIANIVQADNDAGTALSDATSSGWTVIPGSQFGVNGNDKWWGNLLYKVANASDVAAANFSFTLDADANGDGTVGAIAAFRNVNTTGGVSHTGAGTGPFDVAAGTLQGTGNASNATVTAPGITTVTNGAAVIMFGMAGDNNTFDPPWSATSPATLNEIYDVNQNVAIDEGVGAAWAIQSTAGATGNGTVTMSASDRNGGIMVALRPLVVNAGPDQLVGGTSVSLSGSTNAVSPTYAWTKTSGPAGQTITSPSSANTTVTGLVAGTYVFRLTVNGSVFDEVTVVVITGTNLWATSTDGTQISSFSVSLGTVNSGPTNMFAPSFAGSTNTYTRTAALGRNDIPTATAGYFYYLGTSTGGQTNDGIVEIWGASAAGTIARIGQVDMNGAGNGAELGFVRLGMSDDGTGWILAGDGTTLYLAKFASNGLTPVTPVIEDASVTLVGGAVATFVNGDLCLDGSGKLVVLANNGSGTTEIYTGMPAGAATILTKKWDVFDGGGNPFTNTVNGVAFDVVGGLYVSTSDGLYYIDQSTANSNTATVNCVLALSVTGLQDLASNVFPNTIITPVKMGSFDVTKQGNNAVLNWTTLTEINSDHFEIERSTDGVNFVKAGSVRAAGNSNDLRSYQFADPIPANTDILYYRIRTVDIDGKASMSKIVPLRIGGSIVKGFSVYPNPFSSSLKVELITEKDANITLRIRNAAGQTIVDRTMLVQKGSNVIVLSSELASLNAGMYLVEVVTEQGKQVQKIIKR